MSKTSHVILGVTLPVFSLIVTIAQFVSDEKKREHAMSVPTAGDIAKQATYGMFKPVLQNIIADRSVAAHADSLQAQLTRLAIPDLTSVKTPLNQMLIDSLLAGRYRLLPGEITNVVITPFGSTKGFKKFEKFEIEDYLQPNPMYNGLDVITFEEIGIPPESYEWRFSGDTLVLSQLVQKDGRYAVGTAVYKFLK